MTWHPEHLLTTIILGNINYFRYSYTQLHNDWYQLSIKPCVFILSPSINTPSRCPGCSWIKISVSTSAGIKNNLPTVWQFYDNHFNQMNFIISFERPHVRFNLLDEQKLLFCTRNKMKIVTILTINTIYLILEACNIAISIRSKSNKIKL